MSSITCIRAGIVLTLCATSGLAQVPKGDPPSPHTNGPPSVEIISPEDGGIFLLVQPIHICASSQNFTDRVAQVEFLAGSTSLGVVTNGPPKRKEKPAGVLHDQHSCLAWNTAAPGKYVLTARATDLAGTTVTSAPVSISVVTNLPPVIHITSPHDDQFILGPTNITVCASAHDPGGTVVKVQFFQGSTSLGVVTNPPPTLITNEHGVVMPIPHDSFCLTWSNVALGTYTLTAVATDNGGAMTTSAPVYISVVSNLPPIVQIVQPHDGTALFAPANITLCAAARDPDGTVFGVQFFEGSTSLGVVTNGMTVTNDEHHINRTLCLTWSNVPPATYNLTAVAIDNGGTTSTSAPVVVTVVPAPPPQVKIVNPDNGDQFVAPANIYIATMERFFSNSIASVRFLSGTTVLAKTNTPSFYWKSVPAGAYNLTAIATDTGGISATSAPVNITVNTNHPHGRSRH